MDKFETVGGNDLIDRIAAGTDNADRFFVFLSAASTEKPWAKAELHRALMAELGGYSRLQPQGRHRWRGEFSSHDFWPNVTVFKPRLL
jgi:hypothetical protein